MTGSAGGAGVEHLVLTRFSYREARAPSPGRRRSHRFEGKPVGRDPLEPRCLARRFDAFETACLPSLVAQTEPRFTWLLLVDRDLPARWRRRLEALVAGRDRVRIHVFAPDTDVRDSAWVAPYLHPKSRYLLTTALDDDDALARDYVERLHAAVGRLAAGGELPPLKLFGTRQALQWDFHATRAAPLGWVKPWLRRRATGDRFPLMGGFSALARRGAFDVTCYRFLHSHADQLLLEDAEYADLPEVIRRKIDRSRGRLREGAAGAGIEWEAFLAAAAFEEVGADGPTVVLLNTLANEERERLFEFRDRRSPVRDASAFPGIAVDLDAARAAVARGPGAFSRLRALVAPEFRAVIRAANPSSPERLGAALARARRRTAGGLRDLLRSRL